MLSHFQKWEDHEGFYDILQENILRWEGTLLQTWNQKIPQLELPSDTNIQLKSALGYISRKSNLQRIHVNFRGVKGIASC